MNKKYNIVELFAGVGGFRLGLEKHGHKTVWANQWEPKTKTVQYAYEIRLLCRQFLRNET